ncbi:MAG: hypothetical protein LQ344_007253 [Seirophora lacunosa]|nr:MAG: hypothetical protein LQ344_007253 [Seirophora lacunosa]
MLSLSALRSTVVLTMYELISPSSSAWVQHAGGVGRLLEARGPHRHQAAEERMLLEAARPLILAKAVAEGKRCFLEKSDWVTVPWELEPGGKPLVEKLFDAGCPIPGLVEDRKKLSVQKQRLASATAKNNLQPQPDLSDAYHSVASALAARCEQCIHQIRAWKNEWDMQGKVSEVWSISSVPSAGSDYPYAELGLPLAFSDLKRASRYSMYNALLSTFLTIAYEARYEASTLSTDIISNAINESLILKPGLATPRTDHDYLLKQRHDCAIEICRSVPYHNLPGPDHQVSGIHSIMFPLMAAQQVVAPGGEVFRYIDRVFPRCDNFGAFKDLQILPPGVRMSSLPHIQPAQAFYKPMLYTSACGAESAVPL